MGIDGAEIKRRQKRAARIVEKEEIRQQKLKDGHIKRFTEEQKKSVNSSQDKMKPTFFEDDSPKPNRRNQAYTLLAITAILVACWFSVSSFFLGESPSYNAPPNPEPSGFVEFTPEQEWFQDNVKAGAAWNEQLFILKMGSFEESKVEGFDPGIIKAYYFPSVDITILANLRKKVITTWRPGRTFN